MMESLCLFANRHEAGTKLAARLHAEPLIQHTRPEDLQLLSIPSGGVVIGAIIADKLGCDHDIIAVRKIRCPWRPGVTIGAVAEQEMVTINKDVFPECRHRGLKTGHAIEQTKARVKEFVDRFRGGRDLDIGGKTVILVDDGISTGETMSTAIKWMLTKNRYERPEQIIVAVPICSPGIAPQIEALADKLIYLSMPPEFWTVGQYYWDFGRVHEHEVVRCLAVNHEELVLAFN